MSSVIQSLLAAGKPAAPSPPVREVGLVGGLARAAARIYFVAHAALALLLSVVTTGERWTVAKELWKEGKDSSATLSNWIKLAHQIWSASSKEKPVEDTAGAKEIGTPTPPSPPSNEPKIELSSNGISGFNRTCYPCTIWPWGESDQKLSFSLSTYSMEEAQALCGYAQQLASCGVPKREISELAHSDGELLKRYGRQSALVALFLEHHISWSDLKADHHGLVQGFNGMNMMEAASRNMPQLRLLVEANVPFETVREMIGYAKVPPFGIDLLSKLQQDGLDNAVLLKAEVLALLVSGVSDNASLRKKVEDLALPIPQDGREIVPQENRKDCYEAWPWGRESHHHKLRWPLCYLESRQEANRFCSYARELEGSGKSREEICKMPRKDLEKPLKEALQKEPCLAAEKVEFLNLDRLLRLRERLDDVKNILNKAEKSESIIFWMLRNNTMKVRQNQEEREAEAAKKNISSDGLRVLDWVLWS